MRGGLGILMAIAAVVCVLAGAAPEAASAGHNGKNCGILSSGASDYRIHAMRLKCKVARRSSAKYLRSGQARAGFDCAPTAGGSFYCQDPPKAYWGVRL
jgi:hypothetical protein